MTAGERMAALARSFPTLSGADGVEPFDPEALDLWACGPVPGNSAKHAARFVLSVWDAGADWQCGPFNLARAAGTWDGRHLTALRAWLADPWLA